MSVNKVILVGNVGKDPDIRHLESNVSVASFSLATTEVYNNKAGERVSQTEWHNIVCWRSLATLAEKFIRKGSQVYIEGKIRSRSYDTGDGVKKTAYEIYADEVRLLDRKPSSGTPPLPESNGTKGAADTGSYTPETNGQEDSAEDLPF